MLQEKHSPKSEANFSRGKIRYGDYACPSKCLSSTSILTYYVLSSPSIQANLRVRLARFRKRERLRQIKAGFTLTCMTVLYILHVNIAHQTRFLICLCIYTAFFRMVLVRNKIAPERLANCPILRTTALINSFTKGKRVKLLKSGKCFKALLSL